MVVTGSWFSISGINVGVGAWLGVTIGIGFASTGCVRPYCILVWFIHIMVYCSYSAIICNSWLDNRVCGMRFIGVRLSIEGTTTIGLVECRNKVIENP